MATSFQNPLQPVYMFSSEAKQTINISHLTAPPRLQGQGQMSLQRQRMQHQQQQQQKQQMGMPQPFSCPPLGVAATNCFPAGSAPFQPQPQPVFALSPPQQHTQIGPETDLILQTSMPQPFSCPPPGLAATNSFSPGSAPFQPQVGVRHPPQLPPQHPAPTPPKRKRGRPSHASLGKLTAKQKKAAARAARREPPAAASVAEFDFSAAAVGRYTGFPPPAQQDGGMLQQGAYNPAVGMLADEAVIPQGDYIAFQPPTQDESAVLPGAYNINAPITAAELNARLAEYGAFEPMSQVEVDKLLGEYNAFKGETLDDVDMLLGGCTPYPTPPLDGGVLGSGVYDASLQQPSYQQQQQQQQQEQHEKGVCDQPPLPDFETESTDEARSRASLERFLNGEEEEAFME